MHARLERVDEPDELRFLVERSLLGLKKKEREKNVNKLWFLRCDSFPSWDKTTYLKRSSDSYLIFSQKR